MFNDSYQRKWIGTSDVIWQQVIKEPLEDSSTQGAKLNATTIPVV